MVNVVFASLVAAAAAGTLDVTWEDCGATHAKVNDVQPSSIETGGTSTITGTGVSDEDVTSAKFTATVKALGVQVAKCSGDATADIVCKLPAGAATITVKKVNFPLKAGTVSIPVDVTTKSIIPASLEKVDVHIEATEQNGESVICLDVHTKKAEVNAAQDPDQPHLAQAWTAMSSGDGLPGKIGKESYFVSSDKKFKAHKFEYPEDDCTKISLHDPSQLHHIAGGERNYYLGCYAVNCCYSDFNMKTWDIEKSGLFSKVAFVAYEDTTELNDNPVQGAEHWRQSTKLPIGNVSVGYEYYLHRTDSGDVISHRIDYDVAGADVPGGSILYGDFEVQHDLDTFKEVFTPPAECLKPNVLKCADQQVHAWEKQHSKLDWALRQMSVMV